MDLLLRKSTSLLLGILGSMLMPRFCRFSCKNMVRAVSSYPHPTKADLFVHSYEAVESADHVTGVAENLIVKSKSLFQAQLMNAKTEQVALSLQLSAILSDV